MNVIITYVRYVVGHAAIRGRRLLAYIVYE
jgi:hypothetical protein